MKKVLLAALIVLSLGSSVSFADDGRGWHRYRHHGYSYRGDHGRSYGHHGYYRHGPYFRHDYRQPHRFHHYRHHGYDKRHWYDYRRHWHR
jgi:hypothetical protein